MLVLILLLSLAACDTQDIRKDIAGTTWVGTSQGKTIEFRFSKTKCEAALLYREDGSSQVKIDKDEGYYIIDENSKTIFVNFEEQNMVWDFDYMYYKSKLQLYTGELKLDRAGS